MPSSKQDPGNPFLELNQTVRLGMPSSGSSTRQLLPMDPVLGTAAPPMTGTRLFNCDMSQEHSGAAGLALSLVSAFY